MTFLYQFRFYAMGCQNEIRLYGVSEVEARNTAQTAIDEIYRIERTYSRYLPDSLISHINTLSGKNSVKLDDEATHLFQVANNWYEMSNSLFDITSGILRHAWDFKSNSIPSFEAISEYLKLVGWNRVYFSNNEIGLPEEGMELDLGGIAKEYAVDRAAQFLLENGVMSGIVNLGGDIRVLGPHLDGSPWPIQIAHPRISGRILATINIHKGALTTSGDYIRSMEVAGRRYCHILNPKTGWPVSYWQSATVLSPLCLKAGQGSTLAMLLEGAARTTLDSLQFQYLLSGPNGEIMQNLN